VEGVKQVRVGAATLVALVVAVALVLGLGDRHLRPGRRLTVVISRIGALKSGAPLRLAGLDLGTVEEIRLDPRRDGPVAVLDVWVDRRRAWLIRETSDLFLAQQGLLGETYLEVAPRPGPPGPELADGATVRAVDPPPIDTLLATSYRNLVAATALLRDGFPEAATLGRALDGLEATLATVTGDGTAAWLAGRRLAAEVSAWPAGAPTNLGASASALARSALPAVAARVDRLAAALGPVAARLGDGRLRRLAESLERVGPLLADAGRAQAAAEGLITYFNSGRGTLGALVQDVELADELKTMTRTLKREPWRALGHN